MAERQSLLKTEYSGYYVPPPCRKKNSIYRIFFCNSHYLVFFVRFFVIGGVVAFRFLARFSEIIGLTELESEKRSSGL